MKKKTDPKKSPVGAKKSRISLNFLASYLLILIAPVIAIVAIYFTAQNAMLETQEERIGNVLSDVCDSFDREVKQAQNVGYYVSREERLSTYLNRARSSNKGEDFYALYTIASNYPNYSVTNEVIKNVYIFISDSDYILKLPQVIPLTQVGINSLTGFPFYSYETFMEFYQYQDKSKTIFYYEDAKGEGTLLVPCQATYQTVQTEKCAIVVELDWDQICRMMRTVLGGSEGIVALLDQNDEILASYEITSGGEIFMTPERGTSFDAYLENSELSGKNSSFFTETSSYNGWEMVSVIPKSVLTAKIGTARYMSVALCVVAVALGLLVCLSYWYQRKGMVQEYFRIQHRIQKETVKKEKENTWFWRGFDRFLVDVENLQSIVETQEYLIRVDFLRRLLYGYYDTEEQMLEAAAQAELSLEEKYFCVVNMEFEDPFRSELSCTREEFASMVGDLLRRHLTWEFWSYPVSELTCVLVLHSGEPLKGGEVKCVLETVNYELTDKFQVQSYTGISYTVTEPMEISGQYEVASRISEYARYEHIRVPMLPSELPKEQILEQPLFFTMDMEIKLLNLLRSGSEEQLEETISQIRSVYFRPGNCRNTYRHTVEIIRGCLFRSIPGEDTSEEARKLRKEFVEVRCAEPLFQLLRETREYCARTIREKEAPAAELDQKKITAYIEEHYSDPNLNLAMLAEWLGQPERKLYNDFKNSFGISFSAYLEQRRITIACELLKNGVAVKDTAERVGYASDYSFRRAFKRVVGIPPSDFRKIEEG